MPTQPLVNVISHSQLSSTRLPRSLSVLETWGFGLTGHLTWLSTAPVIHAALGPQAIFVWFPGVIIGMLLNWQVRRLAECWPDVAGGTPNYTTWLLRSYPGLGRYAALGYFFSWVGFLPINAIVLTDLIKMNLVPLGIPCPEMPLKIGFTIIAFIMAFSGTRALGILHLFFILPAFGFLSVFCVQGLGWLALSPDSPGFFPLSWSSLTFLEWVKWLFFAVFATFSCESASAFVADSQRPGETLRFLKLAAWLIALVYLGGSWVLMRLATEPGLGSDAFLNLVAAGKSFWGESASFFVTFLLVSGSLLGSATAVANTPRILYQLALDGHISPVFAVVSRAGVLAPSLAFTLVVSLICLAWGDVAQIVIVTGVGWLACFMCLHLGLWLRRGRPEVLFPRWSLGCLLLEGVIFIVGGLAWSWKDWTIGLLCPIVVLIVARVIRYIPFPPFQPAWWSDHDRRSSFGLIKDFVAFQVVVLIILVCGSATVSWVIRDHLETISSHAGSDLLVVLLLTVTFVAIAIACWTSLPQVAAIAEAREYAENLFITALDTVPDTVLVLNEEGVIHQANPAAEALFKMDNVELIGRHLNDFFSGLTNGPTAWPSWSEQVLTKPHPSIRIIETTVSEKLNRKLQEYIVILRDITERKHSEQILQQSEATLRQQATQLEQTLQDLQTTQAQLIQTEKMSSLGQLVAGVAHEINNPVNFIYGNLTHVGDYTQDLVGLINLYQQHYPCADSEIQERIEDIELDFLVQDLPKTLSSMKVGTERIRQIVLTLRNFSRLDEAEMKPVNIHEGIDSSLLILQNRLKAKPDYPGIQISKEYGVLPEVECYAGQLNQVFMNILSNAIDALHKYDKQRPLEDLKAYPSTITIHTQVLDSHWVRVSIKDNGSGMTEQVRARLFDPFFTTKAIGEGTGLGLSISYQIVVEKHGGRLQCLSQPGQGAEFLIEIPLKQSHKLVSSHTKTAETVGEEEQQLCC